MPLPIPPQYDHPPAIPVVEHVLPLAEVQRHCSLGGRLAAPEGRWWLGCSVVNAIDGKCYVVRIDDPETRRHELAHCNGWRHEREVVRR
jgi:hypothetical protein